MQRQIKLRRLAIPEVLEYINALSDTNNETINDTASLFFSIERSLHIIQREANHDDTDFLDHVEKI